jgi:hypothetical protein
MKLEFDPLVNAHLGDAFDIAGPRAEGQAVEGMDGAFLGVHLRLVGGGLVFFPGESELSRERSGEAGGCEQGSCQKQAASAQRDSHPYWPR